MPSLSTSAILLASAIASVSAFDPSSKTQVATYWGQGPNQKRLVETCKSAAVDIVNIGFVNQFPDQTGDGYPGDNFGNACYGDVYQNADGKNTSLLKSCPDIGPDVITCQQTYGKKVLLSIGGGYPTNYYLKNDTTGRNFADFLWKAWGPVNASYTGPRPWGNAVVDGFDFDIESGISPAPKDTPNYLTSGYVAMINHFKNDLYPQDASRNYYISGAPQCVLPDTHFTDVIKSAWFDFMFIQFYNTPQCSARAGINYMNGKGTDDITFHNWTLSKSYNPNVKMYIGLPANKGAAAGDSNYLTVGEVQQTVQRFYKEPLFGGIMMWEATYDMNNIICNRDYGSWMKDILNGAASNTPIDTDTSKCTNSTTPLTPSPDGSCGGNTGYECSSGQCCSKYGYCGTTADYCGAGCQLSAGTCDAPSSASTSSTTTQKSTSTSTTVKTTSTSTKTTSTSTTSKATSTSTTKAPTTLSTSTTKKSTTTSMSQKTTSSTTKKSTATSTSQKTTSTTAKVTKKAVAQTTTKKSTTTSIPKSTAKATTTSKK